MLTVTVRGANGRRDTGQLSTGGTIVRGVARLLVCMFLLSTVVAAWLALTASPAAAEHDVTQPADGTAAVGVSNEEAVSEVIGRFYRILPSNPATLSISEKEVRASALLDPTAYDSNTITPDAHQANARTVDKTIVVGECTVVYRFGEIDRFSDDNWKVNSIRVTVTGPLTDITQDNRNDVAGLSYSERVRRAAIDLAYCTSEVRANASRSSGNWGYGNPYTTEGQQFTERVATKIVTDGQCQITYSVVDEWDEGRWPAMSLSVSVIQFAHTSPPTPDAPEGPGDRRESCSSAQAHYHTHLCKTVETEKSQTQCIGRAAQTAPDLCEGAEIVPEKEPGDIYANQQSPTVQRWLEQDRIKEENKRLHDAECAKNPGNPCLPYPYEEWAGQR